MTKIARVISSPVQALVDGIDTDTKVALSDAMAFTVEGHEHMGSGGWDGRSTLYDWASGKFPAGFVSTAISVLSKRGYTPQIVRKPLPAPLGPLPVQGRAIVDDFPADPDRDYQFRCISILEKHGSFIARVATGGGKSRIAGMCITRIGRKTMFLTTRQVLLYQMGKALDEAGKRILEMLSDAELLKRMGDDLASKLKGFTISYVGDGSWDTSGDVVLCMVKSLADRLSPFIPDTSKMSSSQVHIAAEKHERRRLEALDFLHSVEFVIGEEAHESGGNGYYEVLKATKNAAYRLALTATPMMRDGESDMRLIAMFGPIRIEVSEKQLIDCGILAKPIFKFIPIDKTRQPPTLRPTTSWQKAEELGIVQNVIRNKMVVAEVIRASRWGLSSMVLVKRKVHGSILHAMLKQAGLKGTYIFGESDKDKREEALRKLGTGEFDYLIGSTILDVGVDVPSVGVLVIAGGGKAEVAHRQRIGRALRGKKNMPNFAFVVDFTDMNNRHLIKHAKARRSIVDQTPGFQENVLKTGQDFDFYALGFLKMDKAA